MATLQPYKKYNTIEYDYASELPEGWQLLPNIAIFQERIERGYINEELLSVTIGKGVIRQTDVDIKKDSSNEDKSKYKLIKVGDIAYNKMRMWQGALGYSDYLGISSPAYVILKPKMKINPRYFHYMFRTSFYTNYSKRFSYGIVDDQLSLRYTDFKRMYSIVPPLSVQNSIVAYLDKKNNEIDAFINGKLRLIENLKELKNQIIEKYITKGLNSSVEYSYSGLKLFGNVPTHWQVKRLRYVSKKVKTGTTPSGKVTDYFGNGFYNWFTPGDFNEDYLLLDSERKVNAKALRDKEVSIFPANSVLIIGIGGTIGKVGLITSEASSNQQINAITFSKEIRPAYGLHLLGLIGRNLINILDFTTLPILNQRATKDLLFLVPPVDEQDAIIKEIDKISISTKESMSKIEQEIASIKEYREALITDLVTGKRSVPQLQMS
jgi:type I restriction enzyme S subunit